MQHVQNRSTTSALVLTAVLIAPRNIVYHVHENPSTWHSRLFQCRRCRYYDVSSIIRVENMAPILVLSAQR